MKHIALGVTLYLAILSTTSAAQETAWISVDAATYQKLVDLNIDHRVDTQTTHASGRNHLLGATHVVEIDYAMLDALAAGTQASHHHRGGFITHGSLEEARQQLSEPAAPTQLPDYRIDSETSVTPWLAEMSEARLIEDMNRLGEFHNRHHRSDDGAQASVWIHERWKKLAGERSDVRVEYVSHTGTPQQSVVLTFLGSDKPEEIIILGGHLDSIGGNASARAPGVDDNASGIACLTEVIRVLTEHKYKPRRTLKFMAYAAEEAGLIGSQEIASSYRRSDAKVLGVLQLDMTNFKGSSGDIYLTEDGTSSKQNDFLRQLVLTYQPSLKVGYERCDYGCSDHASWHQQGYPASFPFEAYDNGIKAFPRIDESNPHIHSKNDTLQNSGGNARHSLKFSRLALSYAVELGNHIGVSAL